MASTNKKLDAATALGVSDISEGTLKTVSGVTFGFLLIKNSKNDSLFTMSEKIAQTKDITTALGSIKLPYQIVSMPRVIDTGKIISNLLMLKDNTNEDVKLRLIDEEMSAINTMAEDGEAKECVRFIKIWDTGKAAVDKIQSRLADISSRLADYGVSTKIATNKDILFICNVFANLCDYVEDEEEIEPLPKIKNKAVKINPNLLNVITPSLIEFKNNRIQLGGTLGQAFYASKYPTSLNYAWLTKLLNSTSCISCLTFTPGNSAELADALAKAIKTEVGEAETTHNVKDRIISARKIEDSKKLIEETAINNDEMGFLSIVAMPFASNEETLKKAVDKTTSIMAENQIKIKSLPGKEFQKCGLRTVSPYFVPAQIVLDLSQALLPVKTLAGGFPFSNNIYKDDGGFYFAKTEEGGLVVLDTLVREESRTNSNITVLGKNGSGKSTAIKHLMETSFIRGHKILIIDPEGEYKELTRNLGGAVLDAGKGKVKINPFEIKSAPSDDEEDDEKLYEGCDSPMAFHIRTLDIFFRTYFPEISEVERALLKQMIVDMYAKFNITWDTDISNLTHKDFPIASDLYKLSKEREKTDDRYKNLSALLWDMAEGPDKFLWNGHTNIDLNSQIICFDTSALQNSSDKIKSTQYFNLLSICWDIMANNPEMVELYCDEAYLLIDEKVPEPLIFLRNAAKRCRKYEGAIIVISHSVIDFLAPSVRKYGQALLDMSAYKLFFGMDGINLKDASELWEFTSKEQDLLRQGKKRHALLQMGAQRVYIIFDLPKYKLDLMGTRGGR